MPEINKKNVVEQSRTEVHASDLASFSELSKAVSENSVALTEHCFKQDLRDQTVDTALKGIAYLAEDEVKLVLKEIVAKQKAVGVIMPILFKWVVSITAVITFFYLVAKFWKDLANVNK